MNQFRNRSNSGTDYFDSNELFGAYKPKFYMRNGVTCVYIGQTKDDKREGKGIELSQFTDKRGEKIIAYRRGIFRKNEIYAGQCLT